MMLAIKEAATDLSPYVRKTSAHAIQKLYRYYSFVCFSIYIYIMLENNNIVFTQLILDLWNTSKHDSQRQIGTPT